MKHGRVIAGMVIGALAAAGALVAPAFGATDAAPRVARRAAPVMTPGGFTPVAADPRLAALFARGGFDSSSFRFTPAETRRGNRAVTVAVRARTSRPGDNDSVRAVAANEATVGLAPIAYNLGVAVGWKRFAIAGDVKRVDLATQPGSREAADLTVSYAGDRFVGRVKGGADRPIAGPAPSLTQDPQSYSLDVGGSYSLTRNVDVTAGLRYRSDRDRLPMVADDRRDSQAVYVGTAFRF